MMASFTKCIAGRIVGTAENDLAYTEVASTGIGIGRPAMSILGDMPDRFLNSTGAITTTMIGLIVARKKTRRTIKLMVRVRHLAGGDTLRHASVQGLAE